MKTPNYIKTEMKKQDNLKRYSKSYFITELLKASDERFDTLVMGFEIALSELKTMSESNLKFNPMKYYKQTFGLKGGTFKNLYEDMKNFQSLLNDETFPYFAYWNKQ